MLPHGLTKVVCQVYCGARRFRQMAETSFREEKITKTEYSQTTYMHINQIKQIKKALRNFLYIPILSKLSYVSYLSGDSSTPV